MRKLLNTLFITSEDLYLALENENVVVWRNEEKLRQYPLAMLEGIMTFSYKGASPALMGECVKRGISLVFMTPYGRFLARASGMTQGNVYLRREQYRIADDEEKSCLIARSMIFGKVYNCRWVLERTARDHALRVDVNGLKTASSQMASTLESILEVTNLEKLRGLEGQTAALYFGKLNELILNQKEDFTFGDRNRRPPTDSVNALLSFGYSILANDCAAALEAVGLDAYVGFMHQDRPGRKSLALDIMEELRCVMVDRTVLTLINTRAVLPKHFERRENGAVLLNDEGRKIFLTAWQSKKKEEITHPYLKEKVMWGQVPYVQALLLARLLRHDLDAYPPFLWK